MNSRSKMILKWFSGLRNLCSLIDLSSLNNLTDPQLPLQPHFLKKLPDPDDLIINGIKMTNSGRFDFQSQLFLHDSETDYLLFKNITLWEHLLPMKGFESFYLGNTLQKHFDLKVLMQVLRLDAGWGPHKYA